MRYSILLVFLLLLSCQEDRSSATAAEGTTVEVANPNSKDDDRTIYRDFNRDGTPDRLEIVDNPNRDTDGFGMARDLVVYTLMDGAEGEWYRSTTAILPAKAGGMMGDPFQGVAYDDARRTIIIRHHGGSRQRWNYEHRFRYRHGEFELINATVDYGTPCLDNEHLEYVLSTGEAIYERSTLACDAGEPSGDPVVTDRKGTMAELDALPALRSFTPGENEMVFPEGNQTLYY
ncbi:hypothetical protein [Lewinella sp. 4G2]|uniref:hypothetical protein n=1 Tax=Lewinella sp. 4G2 TaxID=1803372 RepID=UPI0007B49F4A|nr:hypothetical protein [Lewinella sp. 4G2]OAV43841.1 hypothetical protein A3850_004705 [Lewinella sp. 4G2]